MAPKYRKLTEKTETTTTAIKQTYMHTTPTSKYQMKVAVTVSFINLSK